MFGYGYCLRVCALLAGLSGAWLSFSPVASAQDLIRPSNSEFFQNAIPGRPSISARPEPYMAFPDWNTTPANKPLKPGTAPTTPAGGPTVETNGVPKPDENNPGAASNFFQMDPAMAALMREGGQGTMTPEGYLLRPTMENYNFKLGPATFRIGAGLRAEFTDNVDSASNQSKESDIIVTPEIYLTGHWQISRINDLNLRVGFSYSAYMEHPELNTSSKTLELSPGTHLDFKMKIGDFYFNFYERPTIGLNTGDQLTAPSGLFYTSFNNEIGMTVFWDLNKLSISTGIQRADQIPLTSSTTTINRSDNSQANQARDQANQNYVSSQRQNTSTLFANASFHINSQTSAGLEGSVSLIKYQTGAQSDGTSYHFGPFVGTQLTEYIGVRASGGYQIMKFDGTGTNGDSSDTTGPYGVFLLTHRVNRFLSHSLSISYEATLGTTTNSVQTTTFSEQVVWSLNRATNVNFGAFYEIGNESGNGSNAQNLRLFGLNATTGWDLSKKLKMSVYYEFTTRNGADTNNSTTSSAVSTGVAGNYSENRLGVNFSYAF